jgi:hypothetical protein
MENFQMANVGMDGVLLRTVSAELNPNHPYKGYQADPLTDSPYYGTPKKGFKRIAKLEKECPPIVWDGPAPPKDSPEQVCTIKVFKRGKGFAFEVQPA